MKIIYTTEGIFTYNGFPFEDQPYVWSVIRRTYSDGNLLWSPGFGAVLDLPDGYRVEVKEELEYPTTYSPYRKVAILKPVVKQSAAVRKYERLINSSLYSKEPVEEEKKQESQEELLAEILANYREHQHLQEHGESFYNEDAFIKNELTKYSITRNQ